MKISGFWFGVLFAFSIVLIAVTFALGDFERGYDALGGEVFTLALPLLVIKWREWSIEKELQERKNKCKGRR